MVKAKQIAFNLYRYQILPVSQHFQVGMFGGFKSIEELKKNKNSILTKIFRKINTFSYSRGSIIHKKLSDRDDILILKIGVERDLKRKTKEFEIEDIENWEPSLVAINNRSDVQKCLIQQYAGFQDTKTLAKLLEDNFNKHLKEYQLSISFQPIYEKNYFWSLIEKYEGKITQIDFELISPNMSNISDGLKLDLGALNRSTNTKTTHLQLNSHKSSSLTPSKEDELVHSLVEYSAQGGGDISMRAKGVKKRIHTSKGINEISVDEIVIEGATNENLVGIFKDLMK
ncbi:MAG: hypothetical protein PHP23_04580 [Desulfobacterales bacterium]|nr:hypothetical protein [Desulfobacterales bacterium]MDD4071680.1 hypothetical protein [Desulfobacterales bacterium]MDD4393591.1 hypothetical protein [Desulfobacterales bacterium]